MRELDWLQVQKRQLQKILWGQLRKSEQWDVSLQTLLLLIFFSVVTVL
jgi:hypothetical protein